MNSFFELRYALRLITKNMGHSLLCVVIVALSLAISLVVFSLSYNTALKPYAFADSEDWAYIHSMNTQRNTTDSVDSINLFSYQAMQDNLTSFREFGAIRTAGKARLNYGDTTQRVSAVEISPNLAQSAGFVPQLGRNLELSDGERGAEMVVMLSHGIWQQYYNGASDIIGQQTNLDETPHTIIGVLPKDMSFPFGNSIWVPLRVPTVSQPEGQLSITPTGILAEGSNLQSANVEIEALFSRLRLENQEYYGNYTSAEAIPLRQLFLENLSVVGYAMALATIVIVLLACLNVSNLLITRAMERREEFAIRNAVGSTRWQLARQGLLESLLICVLGSVVGLVLTDFSFTYINYVGNVLSAQIPGGLPSRWLFDLDFTIAFVGILITALIWLASSAIPVLRITKSNSSDGIGSTAHSTTDRSSNRITRILVGGEVITSCFLLVISGLLITTIVGMVNMDYGVRQQGLMVANIELPRHFDNARERHSFIEALQEEMRSNAAISDLAVSTDLPTQFGRGSAYSLSDRDSAQNDSDLMQYIAVVSENYFEILDVPILEGRRFDGGDTASSLPVVIIDNTFAESLWSGESPLGKLVSLDEIGDMQFTIVGVSGTIKQNLPVAGRDRISTFYLPSSQLLPRNTLSVIASSSLNVSDFEDSLRESIARIDREVAVYNTNSMESHLSNAAVYFRMLGDIFLAIALTTLILAGSGIFGVISRSVTQRTKEIGIRRALGSSVTRIKWIYLKQGLIYLFLGLVLGGGAALLVGSALTTFFSDLMQFTAGVFILVSTIIGGLILAASYLPTRQAVAMEPGEALHHD